MRPRSTYQLKITLKDIHPPIWRRILIPADCTFRALHETIQLAFGWEDRHLHEFRAVRGTWGNLSIHETITDLDTLDGIDPWSKPPTDERTVRLWERLAEVGQDLTYAYDFGDGWEHNILLERVLTGNQLLDHPSASPASVPAHRRTVEVSAGTLASLRSWPTPRTRSTHAWSRGSAWRVPMNSTRRPATSM